MRFKTNIIVCGSLGVLAMMALAASHLALTDIRHGEADLTVEWTVLQLSFLAIVAFVVATAALLPRVWNLAQSENKCSPTS